MRFLFAASIAVPMTAVEHWSRHSSTGINECLDVDSSVEGDNERTGHGLTHTVENSFNCIGSTVQAPVLFVEDAGEADPGQIRCH